VPQNDDGSRVVQLRLRNAASETQALDFGIAS
jgi:hypothetical protein